MTSDSTASTMSYEDSLSSQYLSSSISSLSTSRAQTSHVARTYRQAAQLFLTRRLYEALSTIHPIISTENSDLVSQDAKQQGQAGAPIATASKTTRVKVWSFYLTLINSIIELGPEEGKLVFGSTKWRELAAYARQGTIWDYVVRVGYAGNEGVVDAEVVVNLSTLLLAHMASQQLNQQRLETYLSALSNPSFDIAAHMETSQQSQPTTMHHNGTSTPRDLNTRLTLLELYTLHILPQNDEWDYARDFISMSEVLDDERRDAFLQALQTLKEDKAFDAIREKELQRRQDEEMEQRRLEDEQRRKDEARAEQDKRRKEAEARAEQDKRSKETEDKRMPSASSNARSTKNPPPSKPKPAQKKSTPPPSVFGNTKSVFAAMQAAILNARKSVRKNPMLLLRFVLFLMAFLVAFARRDVRERVKRNMQDGWHRVQRTVGMGVKVSYI